MNLEELCLKIAMVEDGNEVKEILNSYKLWENLNNWVSVGSQIEENSDLNNHSTIGNQQSNAANALVEKLVNCGDSALLSICNQQDIDPESNDAPRDVRSAIEKFLNVQYGKWINATSMERRRIGLQYCNLVATGEKGKGSNPTFTIIDNAEGQHPDDFCKTFLSITQSNKNKVPFVQGKFGMGSHGALPFCTVEGLQFILSKRNPIYVKPGDEHLWGFTVVRKIPPEGNDKSSRWVYLTIDKKIPSFSNKSLNLFPGDYPDIYGGAFNFGSFVKLYNYEIGASLRSNITLDLYNKINTLLVNPVVPIRFHERRSFNANSYESTLDGLETRLERDRSTIVAQGFPSNFSFNVDKQKFTGKIYAFNKYSEMDKKVNMNNYGNGVMFLSNGQTNGNLPSGFFVHGGLKYENIRKNILVLIDCSEISPAYVENLFKNDRERICINGFTDNIKEEIREELMQHEGLKEFQNNWRKHEIHRITDNKNYDELCKRIFSKNPQLNKYLFNEGGRISDPFKPGEGQESEFISKELPTFFKLTYTHSLSNPKKVERGSKPRIKFSTDAPSDYINRPKDPGTFKVFFGEDDGGDDWGDEITSFDGVGLSGWKGRWTLNLPFRSEDSQHYRIEVTDDSRISPFKNNFHIKLIERSDRSTAPPKPPSSNNKSMPNIEEIHRADFDDFEIDDYDMLIVEESQDDLIKYYLNMDNRYILDYLKSIKESELEYAKSQYKLSMVIIGMQLINSYKKNEKNEDEENKESLREYVKKHTKILGPIIMPLIRDISGIIEN
jgi:hypothetical protein